MLPGLTVTPNEAGALENLALFGFARIVGMQAPVLVPLYRARQAEIEGDSKRAGDLFQRALVSAHQADESERDYLEAIVLGHQKAYPQAAEAYRRFMTKKGFVDRLAEIMGQMAGAQGEAEVRRQVERNLENAFSFMVRVKDYGKAQEYLKNLAALAGKDWPLRNDHPWEGFSNMAEMYEGLGELKEALAYYERAVVEFEARRSRLTRDELKLSLAAGKGVQLLYFQASRTSLKLRENAIKRGDQNRAEEFARRAFTYAEQGKARALLDLMAGSAVLAAASQSMSKNIHAWRQGSAQLATWRGLLANERSKDRPEEGRISDLTHKIEGLEAELDKVESALASSDPDFYRAINPQAKVMDLAEVSSVLSAGTAIMQYFFLGEDLLAWAITTEGMVEVQNANIDVLAFNRQIQNFHQACEMQGATADLGKELGEICLSPLTETIQKNSSLIFIPYGAAHLLPFHALPWREQPLGATHTVSYLPSVSALQFLRLNAFPKLPDSILTIGNPENMSYQPPMGGANITARPLPAAEIEAIHVAKQFSHGKYLIGPEATEETVLGLIGRYPLLHFATHGYLSEEAPLLSAILLAKGEALTVYELMGLNLSADLVVLSACRTGQGTLTGGEDVLGLSRGLLAAGVRCAIVSLWPVNDVSTSLLMGEFYHHLRTGALPAIALQKAQNYVRTLSPDQIKAELENLTRDTRPTHPVKFSKDYQHPYYWAPFILIG
jgi:CHAT domain-containing protein